MDDIEKLAEGHEIKYPDQVLHYFRVGADPNGFPYAVMRTAIGWRFSHICDPARRPDMHVRVAPLLTNVNQPGGHQIISTAPLHIEPSILCEDCGTHGWVRDGKWVSA